MMIFKKKVKVTAEQLGTALFDFALRCARNNLESEKVTQQLGIQKKNKEHLMKEMIIINMFGITMQLNGLLKNESLENEVLDYIHNAYYLYLVEELNFTHGAIVIERAHVLNRYKEYQDAMQEKRGPNELWPLIHHMLNNLKQEETKDFWSMGSLTIVFGETSKALHEALSQYEVIRN